MSFQPLNPPPKPPNRGKAVGGAAVALAAAMALAVPAVHELEGRRNDPYYDIVHVLTVCDGETHGIERRRYSNAECDAMTLGSLQKYGAAVQQCLPANVPVPTLAAFSVFAYNVGAPKACGSSAAGKIRAGDIRGGCDGLMAWVYAGGKPVKGLYNRRRAERTLCLKGLVA
jgi:lysozyme